MRITQAADGLRIEASGYRLWFPVDRPFAMLEDANGQRWAELLLAWSIHTREDLDETAQLHPPAVTEEEGGCRVTLEAVSNLWRSKQVTLVCREEYLQAYATVEGTGRLTDVNLFGGYFSGIIRWGSGFFQSGARFSSLFNPEPWGAERRALPAHESTVIDVLGVSLPGKGHWFTTPAPFCYAVSKSPVGAAGPLRQGSMGADQGGTPDVQEQPDVPAQGSGGAAYLGQGAFSPEFAGEIPAGPWLTMGLAVKAGENNFTCFHYDAVEGAFHFRLTYEGQTQVNGTWQTPSVLFQFGAADPYAGVRRYVGLLDELGVVKQPAPSEKPAWWTEPILCGWGAQCHIANMQGIRGPAACRQEHYDTFLATLEEQRLVPGIVVLDDKWQAGYGTNEADTDKWPDLKGWIKRRHKAGQKVLLWWKAWDPEGLPVEQCVRNSAGLPTGADPSNPAYEATLRASVRLMLSAEGYNADGFKVDFSARVPSGPGQTRYGKEWGVELLHKLLWILYDEAKKVKPDALVMTHTPNPYFADVTDMLRLNDVNTGAPVVEQMVHRALIAQAACPDRIIDTDNWPMPNIAAWREYMKIQADLGVPSLYFVTHVDFSKEALVESDYELVRAAWAKARGAAK